MLHNCKFTEPANSLSIMHPVSPHNFPGFFFLASFLSIKNKTALHSTSYIYHLTRYIFPSKSSPSHPTEEVNVRKLLHIFHISLRLDNLLIVKKHPGFCPSL